MSRSLIPFPTAGINCTEDGNAHLRVFADPTTIAAFAVLAYEHANMFEFATASTKEQIQALQIGCRDLKAIAFAVIRIRSGGVSTLSRNSNTPLVDVTNFESDCAELRLSLPWPRLHMLGRILGVFAQHLQASRNPRPSIVADEREHTYRLAAEVHRAVDGHPY